MAQGKEEQRALVDGMLEVVEVLKLQELVILLRKGRDSWTVQNLNSVLSLANIGALRAPTFLLLNSASQLHCRILLSHVRHRRSQHARREGRTCSSRGAVPLRACSRLCAAASAQVLPPVQIPRAQDTGFDRSRWNRIRSRNRSQRYGTRNRGGRRCRRNRRRRRNSSSRRRRREGGGQGDSAEGEGQCATGQG